MADEQSAPASDADQAPAGEAVDEAAKPEIDWKAKAREWESRAKANKTAADELAALKQSQMSEQERLAAQLTEAQQAAEVARAEALRYRVATKFRIADEDAELFLTGRDEETLTRQAERLAARQEAAGPTPPPSFDGGTRQSAPAGKSMSDLIRQAAGRA